jgi:peptidoglycan/LPS O-acetylase OafA/YrhL
MKLERHIPALDGIRGFAALLVVISHFHSFGLPDLLNMHVGDYGVLLFFILSGFLMGHLYLDRVPDRPAIIGYAAARIARILPLYVLIVLISLAVHQGIDPDFVYAVDWHSLIRLATLTSTISVFWSIGPEFQFYFIFPFIWILFRLTGRARMIGFAAMAGLVALCYYFSAWAPGFSVFSKLHIFVAGIAIAVLRRRVSREVAATLVPTTLSFTLGILGLLLLDPTGPGDILLPSTQGDPKHVVYYGDLLKIFACGTIIFGATLPSAINDKIWGNPAMRRLGTYSFSIYLLHMPAFYLADLLNRWLAMPVAAHIVCALLLTLLISMASYHLYEHPANIHVRRRIVALLSAAAGAPRTQDSSPMSAKA